MQGSARSGIVMHGVWLFALARRLPEVSAIWIFFAGATVLTAEIVMPINLNFPKAPRDVPFIEMLPIVYGTVAVALVRPRMAEWEKLGSARAGMLCSALGLVVIGQSLALVAIGALFLPPEAPWRYVISNVTIMVSMAIVLCVHLAPTAAATTTVLFFIVVCCLQNVAPGFAAAVPLGTPDDPSPRWGAAGVALGLAATYYGYFRGAAWHAWARHRR